MLKTGTIIHRNFLKLFVGLFLIGSMPLAEARPQNLASWEQWNGSNNSRVSSHASHHEYSTAPDRRNSFFQGWSLEVASPGWLPWTGGTQTALNQSVEVHADPFQMIGHLDRVPLMTYIEARKNKLGLYTDLVFTGVDYGRSAATSKANQSISATAGLDVETIISEFGITLEIANRKSTGARTSFDAILGARYWRQSAGIKFDLVDDLNLGLLKLEENYAVAEQAGIHWLDPLVGARVRHDFSNGNRWVTRGDIGGFGLGSKLGWSITSTYNYAMFKRRRATVSGHFGYRLLSVDYTLGQGDYLYESILLIHGPLLGLQANF